jgi:hypothetical protein
MAELRGCSWYLEEDGAAGQDTQLAQVQVILPQIFAIQKEDLIVRRHFEHLHDLQHKKQTGFNQHDKLDKLSSVGDP